MTNTTHQPAARTAERGIRYAIVAVFLAGLRSRKPAAMVNAVFALVGTFVPDVFERLTGVTFHPWQRVYVEVAMLTHAVGMLGPYDDVWWWDHLTHTHSATILSGFVHVLARRRGRDPSQRVIAVIVCGGILWELAEYAIHRGADTLGIDPVLVSYGRVDTALDLVFNLVGAALVILFGDRALENLVSKSESDGQQ
ncbi:hypothetical protein C440_02743 [Haloferax mucosum ATCC BAA-1512]|uniref:DUF2238 domain-containing protein n=1 Tax=Haloferax mucosum ATCC BAA-1512 TaxID=662479 RepID=M0IN34_9EURY|nr:hypothetical protein [Haloferax mucosum]ELZ98130.1 hypothetical protein C440_02743 [Haloferax mucosum ATCC BAA-1512]